MSKLLTKNGRAIIDRNTKLPIYSSTVESRIRKIKSQLNEGLSKYDSVWNNICNDVKISTIH